MMTCGQCQFENPPGMRFCGQCGASLASGAPTTPAASATASASAPSASRPAVALPAPSPTIAGYTPKHLADKILKSRSALEGERRQVTVLFGDIAGFTAMAEKLDPEEVREIIARGFQLVTAEIHRFEGTIIEYGGDGLMALFGAPIAHEDAARRGVHAALAIQRALSEYDK